jgi:hypothetical protein
MKEASANEILREWSITAGTADPPVALVAEVVRDLPDPSGWAISVDGSLRVATASSLLTVRSDRDHVVASSQPFSEKATIELKSGDRVVRQGPPLNGPGREWHWAFGGISDPFQITGWVSDDHDSDRAQTFARALAGRLGWEQP